MKAGSPQKQNHDPESEHQDASFRVDVFVLARILQGIDDVFHAEKSCQGYDRYVQQFDEFVIPAGNQEKQDDCGKGDHDGRRIDETGQYNGDHLPQGKPRAQHRLNDMKRGKANYDQQRKHHGHFDARRQSLVKTVVAPHDDAIDQGEQVDQKKLVPNLKGDVFLIRDPFERAFLVLKIR